MKIGSRLRIATIVALVVFNFASCSLDLERTDVPNYRGDLGDENGKATPIVHGSNSKGKLTKKVVFHEVIVSADGKGTNSKRGNGNKKKAGKKYATREVINRPDSPHDEAVVIFPHTDDTVTRLRDSVSGRRTHNLSGLGNKYGACNSSNGESSDIISSGLAQANFSNSYESGIDSFTTISAKVTSTSGWRIGAAHPSRPYNHNYEFDPTDPTYDPETSQNKFPSHSSRDNCRSGKKKTFVNRNSHSSCNDGGCIIC